MTRTTKPNTLWDLCEQVEKKIKSEPENYCQLTWEVPPADRALYRMAPTRERCGTAYCIGGWMKEITGYPTILQMEGGIAPSTNPFFLFEDLFRATAIGNHPRNGGPIPGTREYAALGIAHLRSWMAKYEEVLKNTRVKYPEGR